MSSRKSSFYARTEHIEVHYHYIREKVLEGEIEMVPRKTDEQHLHKRSKQGKI